MSDRPEPRTVQANGLRFAYLEEGEGPLALALHGFPDTPHSWDHLRPRLARAGYRVVTPWTRGYHPTEAPAEDADQRTLAEDALALIDVLGDDGRCALLIGHDWGASAAYGAAALAPERIDRLVTIGIPHPRSLKPQLSKLWTVRHFFAFKMPGAPGRFAKNEFAALTPLCLRWSPTWELTNQELAPVRECFSHPEALNAAFGYYRKMPLSPPDHIGTIDVPTISFAGTDDPIVDVDNYESAARFYSADYAVETMPGGHFMHREHPEVFAEKLLARL